MSKGKKVLKVIGIIFGSLIALIIMLNIILNIVFGIQLRNKIAELKAQGKPMTIAEIAPPPVPDEDNAAILYNKAFALMEPQEGKSTEMIRTIREIKSFSDISQWTDEQRNKISEMINSRDAQYIYELLEEGSKKPKCNFNPEYEKGFDMRLPHLSLRRDAVRLLCAKALLKTESGNTKEAFDTHIMGLKFSNHLKDEPILISQLVRVACDGIIIECIKGISDSKGITPEQATLIINELSTHKGVEPFIKSMDGERVAFGGWVFERIIQGKISMRELSNINAEGNGRKDTFGEKILSSLLLSLYRPICKKDYLYYLTLMSKMRFSYDFSSDKATKEIKDNSIDEQIPRYCLFTNMLLPAVGRVRTMAVIHQADIDVCRIGLALKIYKARNGTYPEKLESLVPAFLKEVPTDPFSGESLIYKKAADGFVLYSLGPNMKDDRGLSKKEAEGKKENYDIVWESNS